MDLSGRSVLVIDNGFFFSLADTLSRFFGEVWYYSPWIASLPDKLYASIGAGYPNVTRVLSYLDVVDKADVIVFPDLYYDDLQRYLRKNGYRVWGTGDAEWLEKDRWRSRNFIRDAGLPIPRTKVAYGIEKLKQILGENRDVFVKPSMWRGNTETFHYESPIKSDLHIRALEHRLGPLGEDLEFIIEQNLGDGVELGYDGFTIDGKLPETASWGFEIKDVGFAARFGRYAEFPESLKVVNDQLVKVFKQSKSRGFFSTEVRVGADKKPYLIDPTVRCPSPPSELYFEAYANLGDIIWEGSGGNLVEPEVKMKYGAIGILYSKYADQDWVPMEISSGVRRFVKLKNPYHSNGHDFIIPIDISLVEVGSVIGFGDTIEAAISQVKKHSEGIDGAGLSVQFDALDQVKTVIEKAKTFGVNF